MKYILTILIALFFVPIVFAEVKKETIAVPMRDGIKLATDVYRDENVKQAPVPDANSV